MRLKPCKQFDCELRDKCFRYSLYEAWKEYVTPQTYERILQLYPQFFLLHSKKKGTQCNHFLITYGRNENDKIKLALSYLKGDVKNFGRMEKLKLQKGCKIMLK